MFAFRMKELYEIEKKPGEPSYPGILKMVKVRKNKKGQKNSRSLVFRISRIPKVEFNDSGVSCSTPGEKTVSYDQIKDVSSPCFLSEGENRHDSEVQPAALKIKIPKSVILRENIENEPAIGEVAEISTSEHHNRSSERDLTLEKAYQHLDSSSTSGDNLHDKPLRDQATPVVPKSRKFEKPSELRRSSRRILLRLQKEECQTSSLQAEENQAKRLQKEENQTTTLQKEVNQTTTLQKEEYVATRLKTEECPTIQIKQEVWETTETTLDEMTFKRKREPETKLPSGVVCKKRRGRPPKSSVVNTLSNMPIDESSNGIGNEKLTYPPKNSVWTLVPKELFESEFFKSQVLKFRFSSPVAKRAENNCFTPRNILSPRMMTPTPSFSTPKIQLKHPNGFVNPTPTMPLGNSNTFKDRKRPTVIYFKPAKKSLDFSTSQYVEDSSPRQSQFMSNRELSSTESDLMYMIRKYGMVEERIVRSYYEQANGDLNETGNMLCDLLLKNSAIPSNQQGSNFLVPKNNPVECSASVSYPGSNDIPCDFVSEIFPDFYTPVEEDIDTLSRSVIVESLQILFSPEAVLW